MLQDIHIRKCIAMSTFLPHSYQYRSPSSTAFVGQIQTNPLCQSLGHTDRQQCHEHGRLV